MYFFNLHLKLIWFSISMLRMIWSFAIALYLMLYFDHLFHSLFLYAVSCLKIVWLFETHLETPCILLFFYAPVVFLNFSSLWMQECISSKKPLRDASAFLTANKSASDLGGALTSEVFFMHVFLICLLIS